MIMRRVDSVGIYDIIAACEFVYIDEDDPVYSYDKFTFYAETGGITDYDGEGKLVLNGKAVVNSYLDLEGMALSIGEEFFISFDELYKLFGDKMKFCWWNK